MKSILKNLLVVLLLPLITYAQGPAPGTIISKANVGEYKNLLPESVANRVAKGEYEIKVGEMSPESLDQVYADSFYKASLKNKGKYKLDKNGGIVSAKTGKRERLPYGLPFPEIDTSKPDAGTKIMWNFYATEFQNNAQEAMWTLRTLKGYSVEVEVIGKVARLNYDFNTRNIKTIANNVSYMEIALYLAPADLFGTVVLTWRWMKPTKWDTSWTYTPALRRPRRTTSTNRSDPVGPTDYIVDDINGYSGKIESFEWKLVGERKMLLPFIADAPEGTKVTFPRKGNPAPKYGKGAFTQPRYKVNWGYEHPEKKLAGWWPLNWVFVERPVYIVEGKSKDPYYSIGKQLMIVDRETYRIHIKLGWDRSGEFWRTQVMNQSYYISPDNNVSAAAAEISFVVDEKRNRASVSSRVDPKVNPTIFNMDIDPTMFSSSNFLLYGK